MISSMPFTHRFTTLHALQQVISWLSEPLSRRYSFISPRYSLPASRFAIFTKRPFFWYVSMRGTILPADMAQVRRYHLLPHDIIYYIPQKDISFRCAVTSFDFHFRPLLTAWYKYMEWFSLLLHIYIYIFGASHARPHNTAAQMII